MVLQIAKFQSGVEMGSSSFLPLSVEGYDMRHTILAKNLNKSNQYVT